MPVLLAAVVTADRLTLQCVQTVIWCMQSVGFGNTLMLCNGDLVVGTRRWFLHMAEMYKRHTCDTLWQPPAMTCAQAAAATHMLS
jgi:hypothetical protein